MVQGFGFQVRVRVRSLVIFSKLRSGSSSIFGIFFAKLRFGFKVMVLFGWNFGFFFQG